MRWNTMFNSHYPEVYIVLFKFGFGFMASWKVQFIHDCLAAQQNRNAKMHPVIIMNSASEVLAIVKKINQK